MSHLLAHTSLPLVPRAGGLEKHTGNGLLPFCTDNVDKQRGDPVFLSILSSAHTFKIGSLGKSSEMVIKSEVPSICFMCLIEPAS